jgi:MerR family transcriptional regulator, heat shock protein HspR
MMRYRIEVYRRSSSGEEGWISIRSLDYHPELLERLVALGIVETENGLIHSSQVQRLDKIWRLRNCLGVNLAGASIILDLLARIEALEEEILRIKEQAGG